MAKVEYNKEYCQEYYKTHRKEVIERTRNYRRNNPKKVKKVRRSWYLLNKNFVKKQHQARKSRDPKKFKLIHRASRLKQKYGLTLDQFNKMLQNQKRCCALCLTPFTKKYKPVIDHCHKTGKVRGLLHTKCNWLLGFACDSCEVLKQAIKYLQLSYG